MTRRQKSVPRISDEDARLFRDAIGVIRPLTSKPQATVARKSPPAPRPAQFERDEAAVRDELLDSPIDPASHEIGEELLYLADSIGGCNTLRAALSSRSVADALPEADLLLRDAEGADVGSLAAR